MPRGRLYPWNGNPRRAPPSAERSTWFSWQRVGKAPVPACLLTRWFLESVRLVSFKGDRAFLSELPPTSFALVADLSQRTPTSIRIQKSMNESRGDITRLARSWSEGDENAFDQLMELVYDDLRRIARSHVRRGMGSDTVNTTALVHEVYLKLAGVEDSEWQGRAQFYAFCSKAMRRVLIDYARERKAEKRGGQRVRVPLTPESAVVESEVTEVLALDQALKALEAKDRRMARIAECRFFGGLSVSETAEALSVSTRTVEREWARARGYLYHLLDADRSDPASTD